MLNCQLNISMWYLISVMVVFPGSTLPRSFVVFSSYIPRGSSTGQNKNIRIIFIDPTDNQMTELVIFHVLNLNLDAVILCIVGIIFSVKISDFSTLASVMKK